MVRRYDLMHQTTSHVIGSPTYRMGNETVQSFFFFDYFEKKYFKHCNCIVYDVWCMMYKNLEFDVYEWMNHRKDINTNNVWIYVIQFLWILNRMNIVSCTFGYILHCTTIGNTHCLANLWFRDEFLLYITILTLLKFYRIRSFTTIVFSLNATIFQFVMLLIFDAKTMSYYNGIVIGLAFKMHIFNDIVTCRHLCLIACRNELSIWWR